ncbi:Spx/MgsR family RNA polymerase-binding regulatory protein [Algoriphagus limi]|uniref:Spx/MgsR family RNA polymerase-binding regulatory protein n=1 Tax=Algoriphagus limi TaxID=2975273 RepID=A0ABT2G3C0_9BACT|nr:Spx/MgsR family RNA polymerase-binding regulatory protein [Algoriphagus limi]MCS5489767.1 Spx/MgsR family RNA polymerase-binding regulatory protein [Algoriphagus limi]
MSLFVYGIKNCNTMKKTFDFLESQGVKYDFIDYKKQKPTPELLQSFIEKAGLESVINKKGMTYRKMDESQRKALEKANTAIPVLADNSSMIKRPIILYPDGSITLGFDSEEISQKL